VTTTVTNPTPTITAFVVYAANSVTLGTGDHSVGGSIGVATSNGASPQLVVGSLDQLDPNQTLFAPAVSVGNLALAGAVDTNSLTNNGGQVGAQSGYLSPMPPLPVILPATPGAINISVAAGHQQTLTPGSYGTLTDDGIVFLSPGTYSFASVTLGNNAQLQALPGDSTNILVAGGVSTGSFSQIFPVGQAANALTLSVGGTDGSGGSPPAVSLGANTQIIGLLVAPNGSLAFGNNVQATGAFAGLNFTAGTNAILNFQDGLPSQAPSIGTFVAYAERSISLATNVHSLGGDFGVGATAPTSFGPQIAVGSNDILDGQHTLCAPTVSLAQGAQVGNVEASSLTNNGGQFRALLPYVGIGMPPMPLVLVGTSNATPVTVATGQIQTLTPGSYGNVSDDGILNLQPGTYSFASVALGNNAQVIALTGGPTTIQIAGTLATGAFAQIFALNQSAGALQIYVSGSDGASGTSPAAAVGAHNQITALLAAPNGTVSLGGATLLNGAIAGFDVAAGTGAILNFQSGFPPAAAGPHGSQQLSGYYGNPSNGTFPVVGTVPASTIVQLDVGLPMRNASLFDAYLTAVSDPTSPTYGNYITQTYFTQNYAETSTTYSALTTWAQASGLSTVSTYSDNLMLSVSGTVAQIEQAIFANLVYRQRADGSEFVTVDREPSVNLAPTVLWIAGLDNYLTPTPAAGSCNPGDPPNPANPNPTAWSLNPSPGPCNNGNTGCTTDYWANDIRSAYLGGTTCQNLTGQGQIVGLFELDGFCPNDISLYDSKNPAFSPSLPAGVALSTSNVTFGFGGPAACGSGPEPTLDIDAIQAMAPGATILVFQGNSADSILKAMSTNHTFASASNSWDYAPSKNQLQDQKIMAGFGVSYFVASGDFGDIGDPGDSRDLDAQTLTGGTFVSTNAVGSSPYYRTEYTWNGGCLGKDITTGGIMNGVPVLTNGEQSSCFPLPCSPVGSPPYQSQIPTTAISSGGNGASSQFRNFPDVAMLAADFEMFYQGKLGTFGGTSIAAPLWAGFMALEREQASKTTGVGPRGFLNPVLYAIGSTANESGASNLYSFSFNDIADGVTNLPPPFTSQGFPSVTGYDLTTGWGSPTCGLIQQLSNFNPLVPATYDHMWVHLATGHTNVNDGDGITLDVYTCDGVCTPSSQATLQHTYQLKAQGETGWHAYGDVHDLPLQLLDANNNPTRLGGNQIDHFQLNFQQPNCGFLQVCTGDNWDVAGIGVYLANLGSSSAPGSSPYACELDVSAANLPNNEENCLIPDNCPSSPPDCGDGHTEVVRLSSSASCSGVGGSQTFPAAANASAFMVGPPGGCTNGGQPTGPAEPFTQLELAFDTGDSGTLGFGTAGLREDSELDLDILDASGNKVIPTQVIKSGGSQDDVAYNDDIQQELLPVVVSSALVTLPGGGLNLAQFATIQISLVSHNSGLETNDTWNVNGAYVWGLGGSPTTNGALAYTCLFAATPGTPEYNVTDGSPMQLAKQANCPF
jgi:hypothetical protein